ncbi:MAG: 2-succinyl-5-enolpyruvyl-6-hydroxy-3-cyclohexene-1-carboxylic-acid synthase [Acidimicrobiales bacterium]|nr:2-succinyl-5-enolpyruvyl-6-hydroxy-3-cyclohexene-1-carboxylic-acid synthase [Acidimicrobiales bacterium]
MTNDPVYSACAAFANELANQGVRHAVISPGSRSTPLTLTFARTDRIETWTRLDERSAAFFALGLAKQSDKPVVLICTSGTAAANYLPAIVEANWSETPLIVLTANRPPELRGWGAGQTIDQTNIYGSNVRWFAELPIGTEPDARWFQLVAARAFQSSTGPQPGPVHLDWPFREPLEPLSDFSFDQVLPPIQLNQPMTILDPDKAHELAQHFEQVPKGVVVAGPMSQGSNWREAVHSFCKKTGYPLLAEPLSQLRIDFDAVPVIEHHDHLLRSAWSETVVPEVVVRLGGPPTCKPLRLWLERHRSPMIMFDPSNNWADPSFTVSEILNVGSNGLAQVADLINPSMVSGQWGERWRTANQQASAAISAIVDHEPLLQPAVARELGRRLPADHLLYVSNSMPVRDVDSFFESHSDSLHLLGNRGASGIDGVVSSAAGAAATGQPTTLLIGDLAFQHDIAGLIAARNADLTLTIVVLDDQGGGIFRHLPVVQATDPDLFNKFFATPQHLPIAEIVEALDIEYKEACDVSTLADLLRKPEGLRVIRIPVDSASDVEQHRRIAQAVANSVTP